jgi:hypothetical protein
VRKPLPDVTSCGLPAAHAMWSSQKWFGGGGDDNDDDDDNMMKMMMATTNTSSTTTVICKNKENHLYLLR